MDNIHATPHKLIAKNIAEMWNNISHKSVFSIDPRPYNAAVDQNAARWIHIACTCVLLKEYTNDGPIARSYTSIYRVIRLLVLYIKEKRMDSKHCSLPKIPLVLARRKSVSKTGYIFLLLGFIFRSILAGGITTSHQEGK